jgi:hypothetical protein
MVNAMQNSTTSARAVVLSTTQQQIASNLLPTQRKFITILSLASNTDNVTLANGQDAVANKSYVLYPGGSVTDVMEGDKYYPLELYWQAVANSGTPSIIVIERVGPQDMDFINKGY